MQKWKIGGVVAAACLFTTFALAQQGPTPDQRANRYRQSLMVLIGGNFGPLGGMAAGRAPYNAAVVATNADRVAALAGMIADAFARDTSAASLETGALAKIWTDKAEFGRLAQDAQTKANALAAVVKGGNEAAIKEAISAVGGTCGGCHDAYRKED
jgi:cytochrome c556